MGQDTTAQRDVPDRLPSSVLRLLAPERRRAVMRALMDEPNATHRIDDIVNAIEETYGDGGEGRPTGRTSGPRSTTRTCRNSTTRKSSSTTPTTEPSSIAATRTYRTVGRPDRPDRRRLTVDRTRETLSLTRPRPKPSAEVGFSGGACTSSLRATCPDWTSPGPRRSRASARTSTCTGEARLVRADEVVARDAAVDDVVDDAPVDDVVDVEVHVGFDDALPPVGRVAVFERERAADGPAVDLTDVRADDALGRPLVQVGDEVGRQWVPLVLFLVSLAHLVDDGAGGVDAAFLDDAVGVPGVADVLAFVAAEPVEQRVRPVRQVDDVGEVRRRLVAAPRERARIAVARASVRTWT